MGSSGQDDLSEISRVIQSQYRDSTARVVLYAYLYVLLEWLFFVTKPSFLSHWPALDRATALLVGALLFVILPLLAHGVSCAFAFACSMSSRAASLEKWLLRLVPTVVAVAIALMLVDNFSYTLFGWGVFRTNTYTIPFYWLGCACLLFVHIRRTPTSLPGKNRFALALFAVLLIAACTVWLGSSRYPGSQYRSRLAKSDLPNIIMFASDGVNADHMSAYGYAHKTTPNLDSYLDRALIADNAFTNSGWTTGSIVSMLTGKYPATTKVLYPPYTLQGKDAYQSLPRILQKLGYASLQESMRYYADAADLNMQQAFDAANGRDIAPTPLDNAPLAMQAPLQFSGRLGDRLVERAGHLLLLTKMNNPHAAVTSGEDDKVYGTADATRMGRVLDFIDHAKKPFFVHVHLMGTHYSARRPAALRDSAPLEDPALEQIREKEARLAEFDENVLQSDRYFGELMDRLAERKLLQNTLVIYSSDHATEWDFRPRVPLIFLFPGATHTGRISAPTQLLDIAPTVLDTLGVNVPNWMEGQSLTRGELDPGRPVFSSYRVSMVQFDSEQRDRLARASETGPPTYGLSLMGMVVCQRWYILRTDDGQILTGANDNHRNQCQDNSIPTNDEARNMMLAHLQERGFRF